MAEADRPPARRAKKRAMARVWLGAMLAAAFIALAAGVSAQLAPGEDAAVLTADTALGDAMRAADKSSARRLLSLQFTFVDENGKTHERKEFLDDLKSAAPTAATDAKARVYGLVAMVTGNRKSAGGSDVFFLDIWAKQKGAWRALTMQNVVLGSAGASETGPEPPEEAKLRKELAKVLDCKNPCETIPYRVRSPAEQDIVNAFQTIEKASVAHDAGEWSKHIADEFVHYESDVAPLTKADRIARIEYEKAHNTPAIITAVQSMRLSVYGDGAAMISNNGLPDGSEPLLRFARVWVKRNGQWLMVISVQTEIK
jgi:Domain of unknown function (DUF4440)